MTAGLTEPVHRAIATRLRRGQTVEQLLSVGERTGWWTGDDVDWAAAGNDGPRPDGWSLEEEPTSPSAPAAALSGLAAAQMIREAEASTALDGETHVVGDPHPAPEPPPTTPQPPTAGEQTPTGAGSYVTALKLDELFVDHSYQRPLDMTRVRRMAGEWNPRMLGILDVSDRGPDTGPVNRFAIVNGQHRAAAAARRGVTHLACTVHEGLDVAGEAKLMHDLDRTTKKLSGHEQWRARRGAGDPAVLAVEEIAAAHGLHIDAALTDGVLRSYGAAEKLWRAGVLDQALTVLAAAYGTTAAAYQAPLLTAVGNLLWSHEDINVPRLVQALADTRPEQLRSTATMLRDVETGPLHELMGRAIAGAYNKTRGPGARIAGGRA